MKDALRTLSAVAIACIGCAHAQSQPVSAPAIARDEALEVEIAAIRSLLERNGVGGRASDWVIVIVPEFARAGQAPGGRTGEHRPVSRQDSLVKVVGAVQPDLPDTLRVRASDPSILGESATILVNVTWHRPLAPNRRRGVGFRTDQFDLVRTERGWVVTSRTLLGIS
jgi:hypothetical protein